jgi:hypothetical protein
MRKVRVAAATLLTLALSAGVRSGRADTLAEHLPADAVAYAGWAGADALGPSYQNSNLKTFLEALKLPELFRENFAKQMAKNNAPDKADEVKLVEDLVAAVTASPSAFSVGPLVTLPNGKPMPEIAFVAKVGAAKAADLAGRLDRAKEKNRKPDEPPAGVFASGEYLTVHVGGPSIEEKLKKVTVADSLASNAAFKAAMAHVNKGKEPAASLYIDGQTLVSLISAAIDGANNPQLKQYWPVIREGLGIDALRGVAWAGNFDGKNWQSSTFVGMTERRVGLLSFLDPKPMSEGAIRFVPASATTAGVFRFDGARFLADVQRTATLVGPDAPRQLDRAFAQIFAVTGVDVKLDLLPSLGDEFIVYGSPDAAGNSLRGLALVNKLKDPARAEQAFTALENITNLTIAQRSPDAKVQFRTENLAAPFDKVVAHVIATEQVSPAWAIHEGVFYFAMSLPTLQSAVERGNGAAGPKEKGSLAENLQFAELRKRLGQDAITSFAYSDLVKSAPETYELVNRAVERAARNNPDMPFKLPPLEKLMPALGPVLQVYWTDTDGFHGKETSPFPGASMLSPSQLLFLRLSESMQPNRGGAALP